MINNITPSKEQPIFQVINTYEGYIVNDHLLYKDWEIRNNEKWNVGEITATSLPDAMDALFYHIKHNPEKKSAKYVIEMIDGSCDSNGNPIRITIYKITMKQALKFKLL